MAVTKAIAGRRGRSYLFRAGLLILVAIGINILLGQLVQYVVQLPIFLDSIGTILVGALLGPVAGAAIGALTNILWSLLIQDSSALPYAIVAAFIGWAAGYAVYRGAFNRFSTVVLSGFLVGFGVALLSAPITAYLYGGQTGGGTDSLVAYLAATGANLIESATIQGFISDPGDKIISFVIAWLLWRPLRRYFLPPSDLGARAFESLKGYSVAVAASLLSLLFAFIFLPAFERGTFHIFYIAVLVSAWRGGLGPALFTAMIELSQRKAAEAGEEITFHLASIADIPFPANHFDVVMCSFMIFHMSDLTRQKGITEVFRVLKPQGRWLVVDAGTPTNPLAKAFVKTISGGELPPDLRQLHPWMESCGFSEIEIAPVNFRLLGFSPLTFVRGTAQKN